MRHPSSDKRAAQFMFASPRSAKHVRTSSCAKALARMSYTRGLGSVFIVATPFYGGAHSAEGAARLLHECSEDFLDDRRGGSLGVLADFLFFVGDADEQ